MAERTSSDLLVALLNSQGCPSGLHSRGPRKIDAAPSNHFRSVDGYSHIQGISSAPLAVPATGPARTPDTRDLNALAFVVHCLWLSVVCYQRLMNGSAAFAENGELGMGWMTEKTG
jgi:hypothetical protein